MGRLAGPASHSSPSLTWAPPLLPELAKQALASPRAGRLGAYFPPTLKQTLFPYISSLPPAQVSAQLGKRGSDAATATLVLGLIQHTFPEGQLCQPLQALGM